MALVCLDNGLWSSLFRTLAYLLSYCFHKRKEKSKKTFEDWIFSLDDLYLLIPVGVKCAYVALVDGYRLIERCNLAYNFLLGLSYTNVWYPLFINFSRFLPISLIESTYFHFIEWLPCCFCGSYIFDMLWCTVFIIHYVPLVTMGSYLQDKK